MEKGEGEKEGKREGETAHPWKFLKVGAYG